MSWTCTTCGSTVDDAQGRCGRCGNQPFAPSWSNPGWPPSASGYYGAVPSAPGPYPSPFPAYGTASKINALAVASWVLAFVGWATCGIGFVLGLVFGLIGRNQVKRSSGRELGSGLALWGAIVNGIWIVAGIGTIVAIVLTAKSPWQGRSTVPYGSASAITETLECPGTAAQSLARSGKIRAKESVLCHADGESLIVLVYAKRHDLDRAFERSVPFDSRSLGPNCTVAGDNWVVMADTNGNNPGHGKQHDSLSRYAAHGLQAQLGGSVVCRNDTH